jgi:hypothetical protein
MTWQNELPALAALSDQAAADAIRAMTAQDAVESLSGQDILEATTPADYTAIPAALKPLFNSIVVMPTIRFGGTNTKAQLAAMFAAETTTRANILALATSVPRPKYSNPPHAGDVAAARRAVQ